MKTKHHLLQICLLCAVVLPAGVQAQWNFFTNNGTITIRNYLGTDTVVTIPSSTNGLPVTDIYGAFQQNSKITSVTIPDSVTIIDIYTFKGCTSLTNVTFGNGAISIGYEAFDGCSKLVTITIPNSVAYFDAYVFSGCVSLTNISLGNGFTDMEGMFEGCISLKNITIPNSITNIGVSTFSGCTGFKNITIPDNVTSIGESAFMQCTGLTNMTFGNGVSSIGWGAFHGCTKLPNITIPNNVTAIGGGAFDFCTSLTNIVLGSGVTNIGSSAFYCSNLIAITVDMNNPAFSSVAGVLFDKNQTTLIECPGVGKVDSYTIPDTVTNIGTGAFGLCTRLTGIIVGSNNIAYCSLDGVLLNKCRTMIVSYPQGKAGSYSVPNSVTNIGIQTFVGCTAMTGITIPDSVKTIGTNAFYSCTSLTNIVLGNGITSIGYLAFQYCTSLTTITIPKSVTNIQSYAFEYCTNLMAVYFMGNAPGVGSHLFVNTLGYAFNPSIYYLSGTTGWDVFSGATSLSPKLWIPQMLISGVTFGVQTNQFGFTTTGSVGLTEIVVESSTNLFTHVWKPVETNFLIGGTSYFSDPQWTNYPGRFYRIRSP